MRKAILLFGLLLAVSISAGAQDYPRFELFGGYTYARIYSTDNTTSNGNGGSMDFGFFPFKHWGLIANFGGSQVSGFTHNGVFFDAPSTSYHYLFGPRYRVGIGPVTVNLEALGGGVTRGSIVDAKDFIPPQVYANAATSWAVRPSIGVDIKVSRHFSIRAVQAGILVTNFTPIDTSNTFQADVVISSGVVIHP